MQLGTQANQLQSSGAWQAKQVAGTEAMKNQMSQAAQRMGASAPTSVMPGVGMPAMTGRIQNFMNSSLAKPGSALDNWRARYNQSPTQPVNTGAFGSQFTPARQYMDRVSLHNNPLFNRYWPM